MTRRTIAFLQQKALRTFVSIHWQFHKQCHVFKTHGLKYFILDYSAILLLDQIYAILLILAAQPMVMMVTKPQNHCKYKKRDKHYKWVGLILEMTVFDFNFSDDNVLIEISGYILMLEG